MNSMIKEKIDYIYKSIRLINREEPEMMTTEQKLDYVVGYFKNIRDMYKRGDESGGHGF